MSLTLVVSPVTRHPVPSCQLGSWPRRSMRHLPCLRCGDLSPWSPKMLSRRLRFVMGIAALTSLGVVLACGNSSGPLAPFEPQINNAPDNFQFQASGVTNVTWTYTYRWSNTGDSATINH